MDFALVEDRQKAHNNLNEFLKNNTIDLRYNTDLSKPIGSVDDLKDLIKKIKIFRGGLVALVDLGLDTSDKIYKPFREEYQIPYVFDEERIDDTRVEGIGVTLEIIKNKNISPAVILIASAGPNIDTVYDFIISKIPDDRKKNIKVYRAKYAVTARYDRAEETIKQAIELYHREFGDEINFFLNPPQLELSNAYTAWFVGEYHDEKSEAFKIQYDAINNRFPNVETPQCAKALFNCNYIDKDKKSRCKANLSITKKGYKVSPDALKDFLSPMNIEIDEDISLPVEPGLPFIIAVKKFINALNHDSAPIATLRKETVTLIKGKKDIIVLGVESNWSKYELMENFLITTAMETNKIVFKELNIINNDLFNQIKNINFFKLPNIFNDQRIRGGIAADALFKACFSQIYFDFQSDKSAPCQLLQGTNRIIAFPYITDNFIGVTW